MNDLQGLVDALASSLERPIGVDDNRFRLVAYSAHQQEVDTVRLAKLLKREANADVKAWLEDHRVRTAESYVRVPRCERLEMAARIIVPLRFDGQLLGFLALIDEPEPLADDELDEVQRYSTELSLALFREQRLRHDDRHPEAALLRDLLGLTGGDGDRAAGELRARGVLAAAQSYVCVVARASQDAPGPSPAWVEMRLAASLQSTRQLAPAGHILALTAGDEAIGLLAFSTSGELGQFVEKLYAGLEERFADAPDWKPVLGIGATVTEIGALRRSYEQARHAAFLARLSALGRCVRWASLGADATVARLVQDTDPFPVLPESLRRLLGHPDGGAFVATLESYLDNAADASATAAALYIHRSSLYHRLRRIEEISQVDLSSGDGRLELHLGLRLWRMSGRAQAVA